MMFFFDVSSRTARASSAALLIEGAWFKSDLDPLELGGARRTLRRSGTARPLIPANSASSL